jgi:hypothetical protein
VAVRECHSYQSATTNGVRPRIVNDDDRPAGTSPIATVCGAPNFETTFITRIENFRRGHLAPAQQALELQGLLKEYEKIYGSDPGKAASGAAGLSKVESRPGQKGFKKKPEPMLDDSPPMLSADSALSIGEMNPRSLAVVGDVRTSRTF